jgi:hypothetical protein
MCSADYDGHNGKLGKGYGVKKADPSFHMAMGGLTRLDLNYLKTMKLWSDYMRDGFPADAINLHHYSNDAGGQHMNAKHGVSPEQDQLKEKLMEIIKWRNEHLPDKEVWLSEFGYATNNSSSQKAWYEGSEMSSERVQSQWLVRSVLELVAAGVDRAYIFNIYDPRTENTTAFGSCGLAKDPWGPNDCGTADGSCPHQHESYEKKPSWFTIKGLLHILSNFSFEQEIKLDKIGCKAYKFSGDKGENIYCLWSSDENEEAIDLNEIIGNETLKQALKLSGDEKLVNNIASGYQQINALNINGDVVFITTN